MSCIKVKSISNIGKSDIGMYDVDPINISNISNRSVSYIGVNKDKKTFHCYITSKLLHNNIKVIKSHKMRHLSIIG